MGKGRRFKIFRQLILFFFLSRSITPAGHGAGGRGGPDSSPLLHSHNTLISQRSGWDWTSNLWTVRQRSYHWATDLLSEHVLELIFHYSPVCDFTINQLKLWQVALCVWWDLNPCLYHSCIHRERVFSH